MPDFATIVLSFDVEEHHRIEAAAGLSLSEEVVERSNRRLRPSTEWLLRCLDSRGIKATFFVLGELAGREAALVRTIHDAGHEVASHGWGHRRIHRLSPGQFREDVSHSKDVLEQIIGAPVVGYRAPTFSVVRETAWAVDVLGELGFRYDASIVPARHDRYGIPDAPRSPFLVSVNGPPLVEFPMTTLRVLGQNVPIGGGGYFRLLPLGLLERGLRQVGRDCRPRVATLYFHPWEFDPGQERLPLTGMNRFRTYVGLGRSRDRLGRLLSRHTFCRACDALETLLASSDALVEYDPTGRRPVGAPARST